MSIGADTFFFLLCSLLRARLASLSDIPVRYRLLKYRVRDTLRVSRKTSSYLNSNQELEGKPAEAEAMYSRALQDYDEALRPKHSSTLATFSGLSLLYSNQGKLVEAETM